MRNKDEFGMTFEIEVEQDDTIERCTKVSKLKANNISVTMRLRMPVL